MSTIATTVAGSFMAGLLTSLSPCVYPMLPITLGFLGARSERAGARFRVTMFFLGQVLTLTALGSVAVALGEVFGFSAEIKGVQLAAAVLLAVMASFSFRGKLPDIMSKFPTLRAGGSGTAFGAFLVGATSALLASPCTSPVLGGILVALSTEGDLATGVVSMAAFSIGLGFLFLLLGLGLARLSALPKAGAWMQKVHKASSVMLAFGSCYFLALYFNVL